MAWLNPVLLSLTGFICIVLVVSGRAAHRLLVHPLRRFPGPKLWAVSRFPWMRSTIKGTIVKDLESLHRRYGPVIRVAPDELSYIDPEAIPSIYQSNPEFPKDPMHLPPFHKGTIPGILAADKQHHSRYRRALAHGFSDKGMRAQQSLIQRHINSLMEKLVEQAGRNTVDLCEWYNWATFDVIGDLSFGEDFGCLREGRTHDWIASIQGNVKAIPIVNAVRRLGLAWLLPWIVPKKLLEMRRRNAHFSEEKVDKRLAIGGARGDLWDVVLGSGEKAASMSRAEIISNASAIVVAGSETSATLLSGVTWLLLQNPDVYYRLVKHVRSSFEREEDINIVSVGKLDYMLAVLDEAMRLYPPVPMQSNRVVSPGGAIIAGQWVPGGTTVALQQYAACRSELNFHRPSEFLPQRWRGEAEFANDRRATSQPFSIGPRNCIGRQLAYAEMRLTLARILWRFDLQLDTDRMAGREWLLEQSVWVLWAKSPLWVKLNKRPGLSYG